MPNFTKMEKARTQLMLDHIFVASILLRRELKPRDDIPTAAIDRRGQIYYNPKWCESLTVPQLVFLLGHECFHWMCQHFDRQGSREVEGWQWATDAVINERLKAAKVGEFIPGGVEHQGAENMSAEQAYEIWQKNYKNKNPSGSGSPTGGIGDDLLQEGAPMTEGEKAEVKAQIKMEVAQAIAAAKMCGSVSGVLADFAASLIESHVPWYDIVERYMTNLTKGETSWRRPNKRYISAGIYLPSVGKVAKMGPVAFITDISGSVSPHEIAHYNGHIKRFVMQCHPESVHLLYVDTHVQHYEEFSSENLEDVEIRHYSGGGTHMPAGLDYIEKHDIKPEIVIVLTDGYTGWPDKQYDFPVIWCISTKIEAPESAGITVPFEVENG